MPIKKIWDAMTKSKLLTSIYEETSEMNKECKNIFEESFTCLLQCKEDTAQKIADEDERINKYEIKIREDILGYLGINTAPDLGSSLTLSAVVASYERIGDYSKGIAQITFLYPTTLGDDEYYQNILIMKDTITKQFDWTYKAFKESDIEKAEQVIATYNGIKSIHEAVVETLNKDDKIERNKAIVYATLTIYLRRISAHLKNICTSINNPFPMFGFEDDDD